MVILRMAEVSKIQMEPIPFFHLILHGITLIIMTVVLKVIINLSQSLIIPQ